MIQFRVRSQDQERDQEFIVFHGSVQVVAVFTASASAYVAACAAAACVS